MSLRHLQFLSIFLVVGYVSAVPYFGEDFEGDAEFVPLEQQQQGRGSEAQSETHFPKPFEVDVIESDVNAQNTPSISFQQSFPFFGPDFFNSFGGSAFGFGPTVQRPAPWWKGPNVCTNKTEKNSQDKEEGAKKDQGESSEESDEIFGADGKPSVFGDFHFSLNSCIEKTNKYICSRIINENGKKKTITITKQCCHGYGRSRNADFSAPCEKIEIKNVEATASDMGAKEFLEGAKNSGNAGEMLINRKNQTIFMPLDKAFERYVDQLQKENNVAESKNDANLYLRHIVNGEISLEDVPNETLLKTLQTGQNIRVNAYSFVRGDYRRSANCVPIEGQDKLSEQGMIHTLNGVLKPVTQNLMDIIRQRSDMSIMRTVLEKTKLSELLEQNEKPMTIFVPTDSAFDKVEPHLRRALKEGKGCASNILRNHMLDFTFCSIASAAGVKTIAYNLLGEALFINRTKSTVASTTEKSEIADLAADDEEEIVMVNRLAKITEADIMGTNGVMHVLDTILPTNSALPMLSLMEAKNVTIFKRLIEAAGLEDKFDDTTNVTVFAPTDKALKVTKWAKLLDESPDQLRNNPELIEFLNYHMSQPKEMLCDLKDGSFLTTTAGPKLRVTRYSSFGIFQDLKNIATVNCAKVVQFDEESCGSILNQIDRALAPPKSTLLQVLESNPDYSKFLELIRLANLTDMLAKSDAALTLFVPKNEVFLELDGSLDKSRSELENLIKSHIVNDTVCCAGILPTNWPFVRTVESIHGLNLRIRRERRPIIENAGVSKCDSIAVNGVIHEINDIIIPPRREFRSLPDIYARPGRELPDRYQFIHDIEFLKNLDIIIDECLPELEKLVKEGKAKFIGITSYSLERLRECLELAPKRIDVVLSYSRYTLADDSLLSYMSFFQELNLGIVCAAGHALGLLTNAGPRTWHPASDEIKKLARKAAEICRNADVELGKLAMYHFTQLDGVSTFLTGMQTRKLLDINLSAINDPLTKKEQEVLQLLRETVFTKPVNWEGLETRVYWDAIDSKKK